MTYPDEAVAAGAAFMDEHDPGWWREGVEREIDLRTLDLRDGGACVLGQRCPVEVFYKYASGLDTTTDEIDGGQFNAYAQHLSGLKPSRVTQWAIKYGFMAGVGGTYSVRIDRWRALTDAWYDLISQRRKDAIDQEGER